MCKAFGQHGVLELTLKLCSDDMTAILKFFTLHLKTQFWIELKHCGRHLGNIDIKFAEIIHSDSPYGHHGRVSNDFPSKKLLD